MQTPRAKKPSKTEQIAHLTNLLNLKCSELEPVVEREKAIYHVLGGSLYSGEHPLDRAKRVVKQRDELAEKVLVKTSEAKGFAAACDVLKHDLAKLRGKMEAIQAISES